METMQAAATGQQSDKSLISYNNLISYDSLISTYTFLASNFLSVIAYSEVTGNYLRNSTLLDLCSNKFNSTLNCLFARCKCCGCKEFIRHKHCQRHNESWHQINIISFSIIEKLPRDLVARPNLSGLVTYMAKLMSLGIPGPIGVFQEIVEHMTELLLASCLLYLEPIHGQ